MVEVSKVSLTRNQVSHDSVITQTNKEYIPILEFEPNNNDMGLFIEKKSPPPEKPLWNKTALTKDELKNAPSPIINIAGEKQKVSIVVDIDNNKLYRYDDEGNLVDGYHVATGVADKNGKSITGRGVRFLDHKETYPYASAVGTKRARNPKAYGPRILYLDMVNSDTGKVSTSNGEFIHGNNNPKSIGTKASHGCIRMDNEVIKKLAEEVPTKSYILFK